LRHRKLRAVTLEDHRQVLRLLVRRHHQLIAGRTRAICRLHAVLCEMIEGGLSKNLSAKRASAELRKLRPHDAIGIERKRIAVELLDEVRRIDQALVERHDRTNHAVKAADTSVTDVFGVGPIVACYLIGYSGDIRWFPSAGHYARYNAAAPIEASSGPTKRQCPALVCTTALTPDARPNRELRASAPSPNLFYVTNERLSDGDQGGVGPVRFVPAPADIGVVWCEGAIVASSTGGRVTSVARLTNVAPVSFTVVPAPRGSDFANPSNMTGP
jgi:hypothetical protein